MKTKEPDYSESIRQWKCMRKDTQKWFGSCGAYIRYYFAKKKGITRISRILLDTKK